MKKISNLINNKSIKNALLLSLIFTIFSSLSVSADTGPKPSFTVFTNINEICYITLLSKAEGSGPWNTYDKEYIDADYDYIGISEEEYKKQVDKFFEYQDLDGYHNLGNYEVFDTKRRDFIWSYYPPEEFKVLLYFPEKDKFYVSEKLEQFAFDSYFELNIVDDKIEVTKLDKLIKNIGIGGLISKTQIYKNLFTTIIMTLIFRTYCSNCIWISKKRAYYNYNC